MFGFVRDEDRTEITIVLDRSGSMHSIRDETIAGFLAFVDKQKTLPGICRLTLVQFDTIYETVYRERPIHKIRSLDLSPRGGTALLDAMGRAIQETAGRVESTWVSHQPTRTIVVTITDGQENSSREFTRTQVMELVRKYRDEHDWQFVFLGANQDAIQEAAKYGISSEAAMTYRAGPRGTMNAWQALGEAVGRHRQNKSRRPAGSYFTADERSQSQVCD
jgi:hypothetical protein